MRLDPRAVIADLDELAAASGGGSRAPSGSRGRREWLEARVVAAREARRHGARARSDDRPATCGRRVDGDADAFMIVGSHIDAVPDGGWLDGALGVMTALETVRQLAARRHQAADRRAVRRLGRRGGRPVQPQPARLLGVRRHARARRGARPAGCRGGHARRRARRVRRRSRSARPRRRNGSTGRDRLSRAAHRAGAGAARQRSAGVRRERDRRGRAPPDDVHRPGGPRRLDADAAAPGLARGRGARGARDPRERDRPRRRRDGRADALDSRCDHRGRRRAPRCSSTSATSTPDELAAMLADALQACRAAADEFDCTVEQRDVFRAAPTPFDPALVELARASVRGGRRRRRASRSRAGRCTTRPRSAGSSRRR